MDGGPRYILSLRAIEYFVTRNRTMSKYKLEYRGHQSGQRGVITLTEQVEMKYSTDGGLISFFEGEEQYVIPREGLIIAVLPVKKQV